MTTHQTPAEMAEEIKLFANLLGDVRVMAWRDRATREEVRAASAALHAAIDRLRAMAESAQQVEPLAELMRGLEVPPSFPVQTPGALFALGQAIAGQAKEAASAPRLMQDEPGSGAQGLSRALAGKPDARRVVRETAGEVSREEARRYCDPGFQAWLDEPITESGEFTVRDVLKSAHDAYSGWCARPHYAAAPEATEVRKPLTDARIQGIGHDVGPPGYGFLIEFARAIERAHGITGEAS